MSQVPRWLLLGLAFSAVAVPCVAIALATFSALDVVLNMHGLASDYALAYAIWWPGLVAAFLLPAAVSRGRRFGTFGIVVSLALALGIGACVWLEWSNATDAKRIAPVGLFVVPYVGAALFAAIQRNAG